MNTRLPALAFVLLAPLRALGAEPAAVVLLPFQNLSTSEEAPGALAPLVEQRLVERGYRVASGEPVERALDAGNVRYLDSLAAPVRDGLLAAQAAESVVLGTVYAYAGGETPLVAVGIRFVGRDGRTGFSSLVSIRAEDTEGIFEFGRPVTREALAREAVGRLLRDLPRPGAVAKATVRGKPVGRTPPRTFLGPAFAKGTRHRVVVMPFANGTPVREASRISSECLSRWLSRSTLFEVVEAADFRAALLAEKIRDLDDPAQLRRLGERLGTSLFVHGTVYDFAEAPRGPSGTPHVEAELTLTDVASGSILWSSYHARRGTDYRGLLQLGAITNVVGLLDQLFSEMVRAAERATPSREVPLVSGASRRLKGAEKP